MNVIKKDGTLEPYNFEKIRAAVSKSAGRVMVTLTDGDFRVIKAMVENKLNLMGKENVPIADMHNVDCWVIRYMPTLTVHLLPRYGV